MFILRLGSSLYLFLIIFSGGILYTFNQTILYQAEGMLEVHDPRPVKALSLDDLLSKETALQSEQEALRSIEAQVVIEAEDLNTAFAVLGSQQILFGVEQRLQGDIRAQFMAPYSDTLALSGPLTPFEILEANRSLERVRLSKIFRVRYIHPDPIVAAEVANLFMKEFIDYYLKWEIDGYMKIVEDLRIRLTLFDERIEEKAKEVIQVGESAKTRHRIWSDELEALIDFRRMLYQASNEAKIRVNLANPRARIIDVAFPPYADQPHSPDVFKNLKYSFSLGLLFAALPHLWVAYRRRSRI